MKKMLCVAICALLALSLAACGGSPAPETERAAELRAQYAFYDKSVKEISGIMGVTAEQADDIFITLASDCGLDGAIRSVYAKSGADNTYSYYWEGSAKTYEVILNDGVVSEVRYLSSVIYPAPVIEDIPPAEDAEPLTLEAAVDSAIEEAGAEKERVVVGNGVVSIYLVGSDNFTINMIRNGMFIEARDILKVLQERGEIDRIALFWSLPLVDVYGNTAEDTVMKIQLEKDTLQKINFDNFDWNNFPDIADDYFEHAALSD